MYSNVRTSVWCTGRAHIRTIHWMSIMIVLLSWFSHRIFSALLFQQIMIVIFHDVNVAEHHYCSTMRVCHGTLDRIQSTQWLFDQRRTIRFMEIYFQMMNVRWSSISIEGSIESWIDGEYTRTRMRLTSFAYMTMAWCLCESKWGKNFVHW